MARLSVSVWPPADVVSILASLARPDVRGVRWATPEQYLVKIRPLGHVSDHVVPVLVSNLEEALAGHRAVKCVLGQSTAIIGGDWLGVPVKGLEEIAAAVFSATEPVVPVTHPQPFRADLVLARGRVPRDLAGQLVEASWTADVVTLVEDRSSPGMARFEDVAEFALRG